jgi:peptide chain release factor 3
LDVLADRLQNEYGLPTGFEGASAEAARWIASDDPKALDTFIASNRSLIATDVDGDHVFLAPSAFQLRWAEERNPSIKFTDIKTMRT